MFNPKSKLLTKLSTLSQRQILIIAGIIGVLMFIILYFTLSRIEKQIEEREVEEHQEKVKVVEVSDVPTKKVVVAAEDILSYTIIQENMLKVADVPETEGVDLSNAVTDVNEVVGKPARVDILTNDIITLRKFYKDEDSASFTRLIPPDCRAVSISVSDITGVSGFINPGDYVDVMLVTDVNSNLVSEVILQNVMLLAIDRNAMQDNTKDTINSNGSPSTATLALHMDEVMQLAAAAKRGTIYLVLRPFKPSEEFVDDTYYIDYAPKIPSATTTPPNPAFQPPPSPVTGQVAIPAPDQTFNQNKPIEIIQGDKRTTNQAK